MLVNIQLEIKPEEVTLATELLGTLRWVAVRRAITQPVTDEPDHRQCVPRWCTGRSRSI